MRVGSVFPLALSVVLVGCSGGGDADLSRKDEKVLRDNFSRTLTPEEVARMGGGNAPSSKKK